MSEKHTPGDFVLVPREPTEAEMIRIQAAGVSGRYRGKPLWVTLADAGLDASILGAAYRAMVEAAAVPTVGEKIAALSKAEPTP